MPLENENVNVKMDVMCCAVLVRQEDELNLGNMRCDAV